MELWTVFVLFLVAVAATGQDNILRPRHLEVKTPLRPRRVQSMGSRITGGLPATVGQFPYQAALYIKVGDQYYFCGGTLVTRKDVLTAAHCCEDGEEITVILGATKSNDPSEPNIVVVTVSGANIKIHDDWNSDNLTNDLCVLRIPQVNLTNNIKLANLPTDDSDTYANELAVASGWGRDSDASQTISPILRFVEIKIISNVACNNVYYGFIQPTHLCIDTQGGKSTCNGDSGGPLVLKTDSPNKTVVGVTSFGVSLCEAGYPAAFSRVTEFLTWIQARINDV